MLMIGLVVIVMEVKEVQIGVKQMEVLFAL